MEDESPDENAAALVLASLAGSNNLPEEDKDPSTLDHFSESSESDSDDDEQEENDDTQRDCPAGLFGEPPEQTTTINTTGENRYQRRLRLAWNEIGLLKGTQVNIGSGIERITWEVVDSCDHDVFG